MWREMFGERILSHMASNNASLHNLMFHNAMLHDMVFYNTSLHNLVFHNAMLHDKYRSLILKGITLYSKQLSLFWIKVFMKRNL